MCGKTQIKTITPESLSEAKNLIFDGGVVAMPTETVYGLGADATNADAAKAIYAAKGRPSDNPLIIHVAKPEDAEDYAVTNEYYYRLAKKFMPGPLTVILPRKDSMRVLKEIRHLCQNNVFVVASDVSKYAGGYGMVK